MCSWYNERTIILGSTGHTVVKDHDIHNFLTQTKEVLINKSYITQLNNQITPVHTNKLCFIISQGKLGYNLVQ